MKYYLIRNALRGCGIALCASAMAGGVALANPPSGAASADESGADVILQSRELMKDGASKFSKGDWEGALIVYQKAWQLKQHPAVAANMAAAEMKLGRYLDAAEHLKFALNHLPTVPSEKREAVQAQFDECREHLLALRISVNVDGTEARIDQRDIGQTPFLEDVLLEPGQHTVILSRSDFVTESRQIDGAAGVHIDVNVVLKAAPSKAPSAASPQAAANYPIRDRTRRHSDARTWTLIGGATATAISLTLGIVYRLKSNSDSDTQATLKSQLDSISSNLAMANNSECSGQSPPAICSSLHDNAVTYDRHRNISTGAFVASGLLGLGTVATAAFWPNADSNEHRTAFGRWQVTPWLASGSGQILAKIEY